MTHMTIFSNGCSFLTDRPKDGVETHTAKILAKEYQTDLVNLAMGGRGNDRIVSAQRFGSSRMIQKINLQSLVGLVLIEMIT